MLSFDSIFRVNSKNVGGWSVFAENIQPKSV